MIPGWGRSPRGGHGNPQASQVTVHGVAVSDTAEQMKHSTQADHETHVLTYAYTNRHLCVFSDLCQDYILSTI